MGGLNVLTENPLKNTIDLYEAKKKIVKVDSFKIYLNFYS